MVQRLGRYDHRRQSLEVFKMHCLQAIRGVTRADRLQNIKIREDTFTPESITDITKKNVFLGMFAVCKDNIVRQVHKQNLKGNGGETRSEVILGSRC